MKNIYIESYGCFANQDNEAIMKGLLVKEGFKITNKESKADIIIINTCVVKGSTSSKMISRIRYFKNKNLIISGCMPESEAKSCKKSINLTATDIGCYGLDIKTNLASLLREILKIKGNFNIKIGMMNPEHVIKYLDELIEIYKNPKIIKFIHIPLQSGSDKVLKEMNRGYTVKQYKAIFN